MPEAEQPAQTQKTAQKQLKQNELKPGGAGRLFARGLPATAGSTAGGTAAAVIGTGGGALPRSRDKSRCRCGGTSSSPAAAFPALPVLPAAFAGLCLYQRLSVGRGPASAALPGGFGCFARLFGSGCCAGQGVVGRVAEKRDERKEKRDDKSATANTSSQSSIRITGRARITG